MEDEREKRLRVYNTKVVTRKAQKLKRKTYMKNMIAARSLLYSGGKIAPGRGKKWEGILLVRSRTTFFHIYPSVEVCSDPFFPLPS